MKFSQYFLPTLKEVPSDAVIPSHILMIRSGMIRPAYLRGIFIPAAWFKGIQES